MNHIYRSTVDSVFEMTNSGSPVMDQFDRLLLQESHNFSGKTPSANTAANPSSSSSSSQFHPLQQPQLQHGCPRVPIEALCGVISGNAAVRRQLRHDIVRVVLASSGIPPHLVTEEEVARILEALASELVRPPTPVDERATISNELVWSALRDAPPGIDLIQRPQCQDGPLKLDLFRSDYFQQRHGSRGLVAQPMPLKQKERSRSPNVTKPQHVLTGPNVTRSASSAFSACSSGSLDVCSSTSLTTTIGK